MSVRVVNQYPFACERCLNWTVVTRCLSCNPVAASDAQAHQITTFVCGEKHEHCDPEDWDTSCIWCAYDKAAKELVRCDAEPDAQAELLDALKLAAIPIEALRLSECDAAATALTREMQDAIVEASEAFRRVIGRLVEPGTDAPEPAKGGGDGE